MLPETALQEARRMIIDYLPIVQARGSGRVSASEVAAAQGIIRQQCQRIAQERPLLQDRADGVHHQGNNPAKAEELDALLEDCERLVAEAQAALG
jgi:hypothetical protein